jgi:hypothetical protein
MPIISADDVELIASIHETYDNFVRSDVLGAEGQALNSPAPDQIKQLIYLQCRGFDPTSAPVVDCGSLGHWVRGAVTKLTTKRQARYLR